MTSVGVRRVRLGYSDGSYRRSGDMGKSFVPPKVSAAAPVPYARGGRRRRSPWKLILLLGVLPLALGAGAVAVYLWVIAPGRGAAPAGVAGGPSSGAAGYGLPTAGV